MKFFHSSNKKVSRNVMQQIKRIILLLCVLLADRNCMSQEKILPAALRPFIPQGYEWLDFAEGYLDKDNKKDAILILKVIGEDSITTTDLQRPFLILIRQPEGNLKLEKRNDNLVMCRSCGGVFGDPYENTEIKNNGFTISFYGGSNWRWGYDYQFSYNPAKHDWYLTREKQISYLNTEPEINVKKTMIESDELELVSVSDFNIDRPFIQTKWKLACAKANFYDNPKKNSKPRKGYLVKNDTVTCIRILKNFIQVEYENKNGSYSSGFILRSCLQPAE